MDKTTRYLFILISLAVFLILAPLIILYVSGTKVDIDNRGYEPTGIFTVKTLPDNAEVFLDDKSPEKTPATLRFLSQGEYDIRISKEGFFDWRKRLLVETNQVTYAHEGVDAVHLIKKPLPSILVDKGVTAFVLIDDTIWYGSNGHINWQQLNNPTPGSSSIAITPRAIARLRGTNSLLLTDGQGRKIIYNTENKTGVLLPLSFAPATDLYLVGSDILLSKNGTILSAYNLETQSSAPILNNVLGFTMIGNTAYVAVKENGKSVLQTMQWNGSTLSNSEPIMSEPLPESDTAKLFITNRRELFILINEVLYRANTTLENISSHVTSVYLDPDTDEFTFSTSSELWFYNFLRSKPQLLTRNTIGINAFLIRSTLGYGFIASPEGLKALEIDTRNQQNEYQLTGTEPVWAVALTGNLKTSVVLIGDKLVTIPIIE